MKYISALGMHFKDSNIKDSNKLRVTSNKLKTKDKYPLLVGLLAACYLLLVTASCYAGLIDRVVAYVDETAITLSEFQKNYARTKETVSDISGENVLNSMINSLLLLKEAKKMRLEAPTKDEVIKEYIDVKIKSAIIIREEDVERFYREHTGDFKGKDYISVRDEIERYLFELETNRQLKKHLDELRSHAEIKIQLAS